MDAGDIERWQDRTRRIKEKLEQEFPGHTCERLAVD